MASVSFNYSLSADWGLSLIVCHVSLHSVFTTLSVLQHLVSLLIVKWAWKNQRIVKRATE